MSDHHHERLGFAQRVEQEAHEAVREIEGQVHELIGRAVPSSKFAERAMLRKRFMEQIDKVSTSILQLGEAMRESTTAFELINHRIESLEK